jgi:hypothetical protein
MGQEVFNMKPAPHHTPATPDKRDQTAEHDLSKDLKRSTGEKRGESADSIRPYLELGRRLGPPSEGRKT